MKGEEVASSVSEYVAASLIPAEISAGETSPEVDPAVLAFSMRAIRRVAPKLPIVIQEAARLIQHGAGSDEEAMKSHGVKRTLWGDVFPSFSEGNNTLLFGVVAAELHLPILRAPSDREADWGFRGERR